MSKATIINKTNTIDSEWQVFERNWNNAMFAYPVAKAPAPAPPSNADSKHFADGGSSFVDVVSPLQHFVDRMIFSTPSPQHAHPPPVVHQQHNPWENLLQVISANVAGHANVAGGHANMTTTVPQSPVMRRSDDTKTAHYRPPAANLRRRLDAEPAVPRQAVAQGTVVPRTRQAATNTNTNRGLYMSDDEVARFADEKLREPIPVRATATTTNSSLEQICTAIQRKQMAICKDHKEKHNMQPAETKECKIGACPESGPRQVMVMPCCPNAICKGCLLTSFKNASHGPTCPFCRKPQQ